MTGCDAVVNFAAETHVDRSVLDPSEFVRTNVQGPLNLLEWARVNGTRLVQVSTDEVYGDLEAGGSSLEDDALRPSSPYSATKAGGDLLVPSYVRTYGVNASMTRGANTYGPHQYPEKLIPLFATNAFDGIPLPVYGDGKQVREWLHVDDHCAAIELVAARGRAGRGLQRRRRGAREPPRHPADPRAHRSRRDARAPRRGSRRARSALLGRRREAARARVGARDSASTTAGSPRRSPGTATTATGGSRSSPASTGATTRSSTRGGSAADAERLSRPGPPADTCHDDAVTPLPHSRSPCSRSPSSWRDAPRPRPDGRRRRSSSPAVAGATASA